MRSFLVQAAPVDVVVHLVEAVRAPEAHLAGVVLAGRNLLELLEENGYMMKL